MNDAPSVDPLDYDDEQWAQVCQRLEMHAYQAHAHVFESLGAVWREVTGGPPSRRELEALVDLSPYYGVPLLERALYVLGFRRGFERRADGSGVVTLDVTSVREIVERWTADGRYGLRG